MSDGYFSKGTEVEVSSDEEGLRGALFTAIVLRQHSRKNNKLFIQYETLMADEEGKKPLREFINVINARPKPPREADRSFKLSDEVDAFYNDGWWEGVITKVLKNSRYLVYFRGTRDEVEFGQSELRLHREWVDGSWVPPLEEQSNSSKSDVKLKKEKNHEKKMVRKEKLVVKFDNGALVEVSSEEEGFAGAWFAATVIKTVREGVFLVEYQDIKTDDEKQLLREEVDAFHIRPYPPEIIGIDRFKLFEEVDVLYNDTWWVGVISKVLPGPKYIVYFRQSKEELELTHSDLRPHQDWIDGSWVRASKGVSCDR